PAIPRPVGPQRYVFSFVHAAPAEIHTLSLHDALPILRRDAAVRAGQVLYGGLVARVGIGLRARARQPGAGDDAPAGTQSRGAVEDRKSTRLNSSHVKSSYVGFCLIRKTCVRRARIWRS